MIPHTLHHFRLTWDIFYDMFQRIYFTFSSNDFARVDDDMAVDSAVFSDHGSDGSFEFLEFVFNLNDSVACDCRKAIADETSPANDGMGDMGIGCDVYVIHDDAAAYFTEGMNSGVVADAGGGEDACVRADFAVIPDEDWSDDVTARVDPGVFSDVHRSFDGDVFFNDPTC